MMFRLLAPRLLGIIAVALLTLGVSPSPVHAQGTAFTEGVNYFRVPTPQAVDTDGRIEVLEVFSYGCIHCFHFQPSVDQWLKTADTKRVRFAYLPAAFREDFAVFARGFFAADALGAVQKTHVGVYDAVWNQHVTVRTVEDLAPVYEKLGVPRAQFLSTAQSFSVEAKLRQSLQTLQQYGIDGTPSIIVAGKYRVTAESAGSADKMFDVVNYLVDQERPAKK